MLMPGVSVGLIGRLGADPDIKYFESGACLASFSLAVDRGKDTPPNWFAVKLWGRTAEIAANYLRKGSQVGVYGQLGQESWQDRTTGEGREKVVVQGERLTLIGGKSSDNTSYDDEF